MRNFGLVLFLFLANHLCSQSIVENNLSFILKGKVLDKESKQGIDSALIKLIGTDGTSIQTFTDSNGQFNVDLTDNSAFSLTISKEGFLNAKGREKTIGLKESKTFIHEYQMAPIATIHEGYIGIDFDSTFTLSPFEFKADTLVLFKKHSNLDKNLIASRLFKTSKNKYKLVDSSKSEKVLNIQLMDTSKIQISNGQMTMKYWIIGYSTKSIYRFELMKIKN